MTKSRVLFLDRDGVINVDKGYVGTIDRFEFMPDAISLMRSAKEQGFRIAVVTNQSGVARGLFSSADYAAVTRHMSGVARAQGAEIDLIFACFEHPAGTVPGLARDSFWRKPNPGMILDAAIRLNADLPRSVLLGDSLRDVSAGLAAGVGKNMLLSFDKQMFAPGVLVVGSYDAAIKELCF